MNGGWKYASASVIGTSHLKTVGAVCQDAHRCLYVADVDRLVCVVCDGAGSASRSDEASRFVCDLIERVTRTASDEIVHTKEFATQTLSEIQMCLEELAGKADSSLREFACTLLVAILSDDKSTFWQLGDGAICFRSAEMDSYQVVFWPSKGEYANTTYFVTDAQVRMELEFDSRDLRVADIAVFSDGLERLALDFKARKAHTKFFTGLFPYLYEQPVGEASEIQSLLKQFLNSERINAKTDDDKTLVLATRELACR